MVLCAWTSSRLQRCLNAVQGCLTAVGPALNMGKSATLAVAINAKAKRYVVDTSEAFELRLRNLSMLEAASQLSDLGIRFQP